MFLSSAKVRKLAYIVLSIGLFFFIFRTLTAEMNARGNEVFTPPPRNPNKDTVRDPNDREDPDLVDTFPAYDAGPMVRNYLSQVPVLIFSKTTCPFSAKAKDIFLKRIKVSPLPAVFEVNNDEHDKEIMQYLEKISGRKTVPNIFVDGVSIGGFDELDQMSDEALIAKLKEMGHGRIQVAKY